MSKTENQRLSSNRKLASIFSPQPVHCFSVDARSGDVRAFASSFTDRPTTEITGPEAKALRTLVSAWDNNAVQTPLQEDLATGRFTLSVWTDFHPTVGFPGYYFSYVSGTMILPPTGVRSRNEPYFINYRVDPSTFKVFVEPKIG